MASLYIYGLANIDYSMSGTVRSFELNDEIWFDVEEGISKTGWEKELYKVIKQQGLDIDDGRGLHAFVKNILDEHDA